MPAGTSSQKDWRPPCTKAQDPEGYKRVGEIVETIILNGQNPTKKTFREIDPELFDSYKETSIRNTIASWKRKLLANHRDEGLNTGNTKENSQVPEDSEDDEDYISGNSDLEGDYDQDNFHDDDEFVYSDDKKINKDSSSIPPASPRPSTTVKFADNLPNPILKNPKRTDYPEMVRNKTQEDNETGRNIMTCDVVNIPGNPKRVLLQIAEDEELTRFLRVQFCCNAGPMKDVANNFKVTPHDDGKGCEVVIPISADFFLERNASILGYGHEADGRVRGPIKHLSTLRSKFQSEDNLYNVVETYNVSFGPLKVKKRVIDPNVKTKNIYCPTFIFYFEIDEEKATRKQKITLDGDDDENSGGINANNINPNHVQNPPFASPTTSHHSPATATTSAPYHFSSPNAAFFTSPPPPAPQSHHAAFPATNIHAYNPQFTTGPNHHAHYFSNHTGNHHATPAGTTTGATPPVFLSPPPPGVTIDPSLIVEYLKNLSFAGAAHHQQPQSGQQQNVYVGTAAAGQTTGREESTFHAQQVPNDTHDSHQHNSSSKKEGTKFKRGERHIDVSGSREDFSHQRMLRGKGSKEVTCTVEPVVSDAGEENYLSPAAYSQASTNVGGNGFFPAVCDDDDL